MFYTSATSTLSISSGTQEQRSSERQKPLHTTLDTNLQKKWTALKFRSDFLPTMADIDQILRES